MTHETSATPSEFTAATFAQHLETPEALTRLDETMNPPKQETPVLVEDASAPETRVNVRRLAGTVGLVGAGALVVTLGGKLMIDAADGSQHFQDQNVENFRKANAPGADQNKLGSDPSNTTITVQKRR